ncbi:MAG: hypothetical protein LDL13_08050 [Calditerrivibrio sp.]|nr:hypothetical protein [Calditerrivibrio sp.]MCA1933514.1 hypothetical protein [Calditerrivibrio sp.]MCA1980281.1 hypothetical protein [Calditerrivibrio sp.]
MKQFSRTTVYIVVSILFHFTVLLYLPDLSFEINMKKKIPVEVELIKIPLKSVKSEQDLNALKQKEVYKGGENKKGNPSPSGIIKPNVELPIVSVLEKIPVSDVPKNNNDISMSVRDNTQINVGKEIKSVEAGLSKNSENLQGKGKSSNLIGRNDFFEIKSNSNADRKIIHIPDKPTFSLESNTKVNLRFSIDSKGIPYSIVLLNKSNPNIENIAVKFVNGLRFESVPYKTVDTVEITLFFNVR